MSDSEYYNNTSYDDGGYKSYLKSIKKIPRISKEEEVRLSKIILEDKDNKLVKEAVDKLIVSNLLLVVKYATKYYNKFGVNRFDYEIALMDLIEEGNIGLMRAAKTYDASKSGFSTYATYHIRKTMYRSANQSKFIRTPANHLNITQRIRKLKQNDVEITDSIKAKIAEECKVSTNQVDFVLKCQKITVSGFDSFGRESLEDESTLDFLDTYVDKDAPITTIAEENEDKNYLLSKISKLSPMEQEAIFIKFFGDEPVTCEEMAEVWGVSKQRISQVLIGALKKLKFKIESDRRKEK